MIVALFDSAKKGLILLAAAAFLILACGAVSDVHLGDEVIHYRLARTIYQTHQWPLYDAMNQSYRNQRFYFVDPMLWHTLLAGIWKLTGGVTKFAAQSYQSLYFFFLILSTYIFSKEKYGRESAAVSAFLLACVPVIPALSIILHTDVPVVAVIMGSLACMIKKKYVLAGVLAGCAILMKRTAYVFLPGFFIFCAMESEGSVRDKFQSVMRFSVPFFSIACFGFLQAFIMDKAIDSTLKTTDMLYHLSENLSLPLKDVFNLKHNLWNLPLFTGVVMLYSLLMYIGRGVFSKKDVPVHLAILSVVFLACLRFGSTISLRYLIVALPFMAIIAARGFLAIRSGKLKIVLVFIGICQFISAVVYTTHQRILPPQAKDFYAYIRENTPADIRIMSSRPDPQLYAERRTIWNNYLSIKELPYLFWAADNQEALTVFNKYDIDYILVEKERIYDDAIERHQLGWPVSFVNRLQGLSCLHLVLRNQYYALYRIVR